MYKQIFTSIEINVYVLETFLGQIVLSEIFEGVIFSAIHWVGYGWIFNFTSLNQKPGQMHLLILMGPDNMIFLFKNEGKELMIGHYPTVLRLGLSDCILHILHY